MREVLSVRERERERDTDRERDGSDVTIVALKLAMNLHFSLPKIRKFGDELTLSLAKNSHFSFPPSHFPSLPSRRGHNGGAEIRNEFTHSMALFPLFQMARAARLGPAKKSSQNPILKLLGMLVISQFKARFQAQKQF